MYLGVCAERWNEKSSPSLRLCQQFAYNAHSIIHRDQPTTNIAFNIKIHLSVYLFYSCWDWLANTTLQCKMFAKLSLHRFWPCHEKGLIKTIQTIPHSLYVSLKLTSLYCGLRLILVYPNPLMLWVSFESSWWAPVFMAGPKPMRTESGIHQRLESCANDNKRQ